MKKLNIAFITPESVPYAKTGGLADISGILPLHLAEKGHNVKLIMPCYRQIISDYPCLNRLPISVEITIGKNKYAAQFFNLVDSRAGLETIFIANDYFFDRPELYRDSITGEDYVDNDERFIFFSRAVLEGLRALSWRPDIWHANDWQSALVPVYLKTIYENEPFYKGSFSIFTIHNLAYQGLFPEETFPKLNLDKSLAYATGPLEFWGKINFVKAAISFADKITTVSPTYAGEIQGTADYGMGLEGVLRQRRADLVGILNGVDYNIWSPTKDRFIPAHYYLANLSGKKKNKLALLHRAGFPIRMDIPLIGMISRLDSQKGFDLIEEIRDELMALNLQFILLGTGDEQYHALFNEMETAFPDKFKFYMKFDNELAHLIEAGSDIFLMPSRYEPCGLNQMYSLKYGTIPIVRKTGGLADTVVDFDETSLTGTGFVFDEYDSDHLLDAIERAIRIYGRRKTWYKIMKQGMKQDFSWEKSMQDYLELYASLYEKAT
jgi:starch synthase